MAGTTKHKKVSTKIDSPDTTLIRPIADWGDEHLFAGGTHGQTLAFDTAATDKVSWHTGAPVPLANKTGDTLAVGDVLGLDATNDSAVVFADTQGAVRPLVVAAEAVAIGATVAMFVAAGVTSLRVAGATTRGNFLRKSATNKAAEDTGVAATLPIPTGSFAIALSSIGVAGTIQAFLLGITVSAYSAFGNGSAGAVTDGGGGTIIRNGILQTTTYQLGGANPTTLTHDVSRSVHIKAQSTVTLMGNATVNLNGKGAAGGAGGIGGGAAAVVGNPGVFLAGGGGGGGGSTRGGANGSVGLGGIGGAVNTVGGTGFRVLGPSDLGYAGFSEYGPGGGGGGGGDGAAGVNGGTGGAGGGCLIMETPSLTLTVGYAITATGVTGGAGVGSAAGGGGGGAGGSTVFRRRTLVGTSAFTVTGGTGGLGSGGGGNGGNGADGFSLDEAIA